jgi:hypothetical protein
VSVDEVWVDGASVDGASVDGASVDEVAGDRLMGAVGPGEESGPTTGPDGPGDRAADGAADGDAGAGSGEPLGFRFAPAFPVLLVRRDDGPRAEATAGAVVAGLPGATDPPGGPAGEVLAGVEGPPTAAPLGRGVADVLAGARVVVRAADGAALLTVTRPDARPTVVVTVGAPVGIAPDRSAGPAGPGGAGFTATREDDGGRWSIVFRRGGAPCGRLEPEDLLGRRWVLADTEPRATVHRRIAREADRRRSASVGYEVRAVGPESPAPAGRPVLDAATLWVVGAVLALDLLDTQLPDRAD